MQRVPKQSGLRVENVRAGGREIRRVKPARAGCSIRHGTAVIPIGPRQHIIVVAGINVQGDHHLAEIIEVGSFGGLIFCAPQHRQQQRRQNRDDGDDYEQFNQGECPEVFHCRD